MELKNGMDMPEIGLGTWQLTGDQCTNAVRQALELGYTHIDTAEMYGNQKEIGEALKGFDRKDIFITSKVWRDNLSYDGVLEAFEKTAQELGTDYLDLYLIHWPNDEYPLEDTLKALRELKEQGKIKAIGVSNFTIPLLKEALEIEPSIVVNQVEYHPLLNQEDLLEFAEENGVKITAYSPLARTNVFDEPTLKEIAEKHGKTPGQVSLRWLVQKGLIAIPKASSREHLEENLDIDFELSDEDMEKIDNIDKMHRQVHPGFAKF